MKVVIFAGGIGSRLWPISREKTPKQFDRIFNGKSTLELMVERVTPIVDWSDIYISTAEKYLPAVHKQLPKINLENIITEPDRRDLAPAVGLAMTKLSDVQDEPVAILWADHLMSKPGVFRKGLKVGEKLIKEDPNRFIFFAQPPRYAEQNLGWIKVGDEIEKVEGVSVRKFKDWHYRPPLDKCKNMFASKEWILNVGYWVTTPKFVLSQYEDKKPGMYKQLKQIEKRLGSSQEGKILKKVYPKLEKISFDDAILQKMKPSQAVVLKLDLGWSDPGNLYSIKEALQKSVTSNVTKGNVIDYKTKDSFIYSTDPKKTICTVGLEGMIVVETQDAVLVVHKDNVPEVKKLVSSLKNTKWDKLT